MIWLFNKQFEHVERALNKRWTHLTLLFCSFACSVVLAFYPLLCSKYTTTKIEWPKIISQQKNKCPRKVFFFYSTLAQISSHNWPNRLFPCKSLSIFRCTVGLDFKFGLQLDKHFKAKKLLVLFFSKKSSSIYDDRVQWRWEVNFFFKSWYMIARELYPFLMIAIFPANHWLVSIYTPYIIKRTKR